MKTGVTAVVRPISFVLILIFLCNGALPEARSLASPIVPLVIERQLRQSDQPRVSAPALDIARAVPYPVDFPALESALGFLDGRFVSGEDQALRTLDGSVDDASLRGAKRQLLRAGWLRRYESRLAAPLAGSPDQFGVQVSSFVVEYASAEDAGKAFAALANDSAGAVYASVGDESITLEFAGTTPDTNTAYQAVKLVFRVGPLLCSMTFADLTDAAPSVDTIVSAGELVAERARIVVEQGTVPLGSMMLQFMERGDSRNDVYATRAGVQTHLLSESALDSFALPQAAGDAFVSRMAIAIANPRPASSPAGNAQDVIEIEGEASGTPPANNVLAVTPAPEVSLFTALFSFNADSEASEWLNVASAEAANGRDGAFAPIDAPPIGDESIAFQLDTAPQPADRSTGFLLLARFGTFGIIQELQSSTGVSLEGAANVMRQQLACIAQVGCSGFAEVPQSVFGGQDVPIDVNLAPELPQESAEPEPSAPVNEAEPLPAATVPPVETAPVAPVEEAPAAESATDVPEELTEPAITSAPAPEPTPEEEPSVDVPVEADPTPATDPTPASAPTTTPAAESPEAATGSDVTPLPEVAETPAASGETPIASAEEAPVAATETAPAESTDAPAPEVTAAPVPADAPIGAAVPPPVDDVVQTPAESSTDAVAAPDFTEPAPAATEADTSDDDGDRESRRDRERRRTARTGTKRSSERVLPRT